MRHPDGLKVRLENNGTITDNVVAIPGQLLRHGSTGLAIHRGPLGQNQGKTQGLQGEASLRSTFWLRSE